MKSVFLRNILLALLFLCLLFPMGCNISDGSDDTTEPEITEAAAISSMKSFFEGSYDREKNNYTLVIEDFETLGYICDIADTAPNTSKYFFRGNVKDPDYISTYTEEYFKTGYLIAVYKLDTVGNLSHEISASKDSNTVNVQIKRIEPPVRENMIGAYVYVTAIEGKYNGEEIKLNIEETAIESVPGETYEHKDY